MGPTKDSAQTAVGALSRPPPPLLPRLPWSRPSFRFRQIRGSFLLLPASPAGGPSPAPLPLLPARHRGFQAGASGPGSNPRSPQAHSLTSLTPGCSHLARGQRRFWPDRAAARVPSWVHAMRGEQRGRHEPSARARRLPPPPLLSRVAPALSLRPPMARPATPSRALAGAPRPPPPAWQASRPRSLSRPARCGTAAFAARPRRTRAGVGGAAGRRERPAWALEPLGATQVGLRSQKPRLWSGRRGGGPPGPTEPLARCGGARPEGTHRARQGLPSPGPRDSTSSDPHASPRRRHPRGPPHQGTLASAAPLPPIP